MGLDPVTLMAGSSLVSGLMGANAASDAASAQVGASREATQAQRDMFNKTVQLQAPFRQSGVDAMTKLNYLLGIGSPGANGGGAPQETEAQIRARLAPQFTSAPGAATAPDAGGVFQYGSGGAQYVLGDNGQLVSMTGQPAAPSVDQGGLDAAVRAEMAKQGTGAMTPQSAGGDFGSLQKPFGMSDFQLDPGIQFQMQQGNLALQNSQAAKDGVLSGGALKDLMSFNQGLAGTGYQSAFDRYMANKNFTLGSLMDMTRLGQAAAGNTVNAAPSFASGIAGTIQGAGNASAAGSIGTANALSGGLSGASAPYYLRDMLQTMRGGGAGGMSPPNPYYGGSGIITDAPLGTEALV